MPLLTRLVRAHLRSPLRGKTRLTLALAGRCRELQQVRIDIDGARPLFLDLRDASNHELFRNAPYRNAPWQWTTQTALRTVVRPGDVVFDVGANRGLHAVLLAGLVGPAGRVVCFEPNPALLPSLERTIAETAWMTLLPLGATDADGRCTLFVGANHEMGSVGNWVERRSGERTRQVPIRTARLDTLRADDTVPAPDVVKIDIEGNELRAFCGARALLDRTDAPILIYESNVFAAPVATGRPATAATNFLLELTRPRYQCFFLWSWGLVTRLERDHLVHGDIIAIPAARADRWPALSADGMCELSRPSSSCPPPPAPS